MAPGHVLPQALASPGPLIIPIVGCSEFPTKTSPSGQKPGFKSSESPDKPRETVGRLGQSPDNGDRITVKLSANGANLFVDAGITKNGA